MSKTVNSATLLGNTGKDPEVKQLPSGDLVANVSLATSSRSKDRGGEWQERPEWHNLVAFGRTAEVIRAYVRKGSKLYVSGRIQTRSWDGKDGQKQYRTEIIVNELVLLDSRGDGSRNAPAESQSPARIDRASEYITDGDIPF